MMRRLLASHWTAVAIGVVLLVLHGRWLAVSEHKADVISGFGVALAVLGILVTTQPYIRKGIKTTARQQFGLSTEHLIEEEHAESDAVRHVMKERVFGVILIAIGTLFNGYAGALARLFSSTP